MNPKKERLWSLWVVTGPENSSNLRSGGLDIAGARRSEASSGHALGYYRGPNNYLHYCGGSLCFIMV